MEISFVYIIQASNGLVKIGKANDVKKRRRQLEQLINMFNTGQKVMLTLVKAYPTYSEEYAFGLESYLHEYFSECSAQTSSREVFDVPVRRVVEIADLYSNAFQVAQTIKFKSELLSEGRENPQLPA